MKRYINRQDSKYYFLLYKSNMSSLNITCPFCSGLFASTDTMHQHQRISKCAQFALRAMLINEDVNPDITSDTSNEQSFFVETVMEDASGNKKIMIKRYFILIRYQNH